MVGKLILWDATRDLLGIYSGFAREIFVDCFRCLTVGMVATWGWLTVGVVATWGWLRGVVGVRRDGCEAWGLVVLEWARM